MSDSGKGLVVAIDGPAGAGKSTVARILARRFGLTYIDSGAMYRCVALASQRQGIHASDEEGLGRCARSIRIELRPGSQETTDPRSGLPILSQVVALNGQDVTTDIRDNAISNLSSVVSQFKDVRVAMIGLQRQMGKKGRVIMEGRDIGTVVFPDAAVKVFLTASSGERSVRRSLDLENAGGPQAVDRARIEREIQDRDRRDSARSLSPLEPAADAIIINSDGLTVPEVVDRIAALIRRRLPARSASPPVSKPAGSQSDGDPGD